MLQFRGFKILIQLRFGCDCNQKSHAHATHAHDLKCKQERERKRERLMPSMQLQRCFTMLSLRLLPPHDVQTSTLLPIPWSPCTGIHLGPSTHSLPAAVDPFGVSTSTSTFLSPWGVRWDSGCDALAFIFAPCAQKSDSLQRSETFPSGCPRMHTLLKGSPSWWNHSWWSDHLYLAYLGDIPIFGVRVVLQDDHLVNPGLHTHLMSCGG